MRQGPALGPVHDVQRIVRSAITEVGYTRAKFGYDADTCAVLSAIHEQSRDIGQGVDTGGAGDQGLMFGFACRETEELMPLPIMLAHKLVRGLSQLRRAGTVDYLRPDGKSQVTVEYDGDKPVRIDAIVLSTQHSEDATQQRIKDDLRRDVAIDLLGEASLSVAEVAERVGFNEASAFHRAFKKWTGVSPGAYRRGQSPA